jgi:pilus assembly protein Flp/PilA
LTTSKAFAKKGAETMKGQGLLEYALVLVLVALIVIAAIYLFGQSTGNLYNNIITNF